MHIAKHLIAPAAFAAAALLITPASAMPATGALAGLKSTAAESNGVEDVRHRCYRHRGHWHCPRHHRRYYNYGYYPGFSLYIGGGRGYWGGRRGGDWHGHRGTRTLRGR